MGELSSLLRHVVAPPRRYDVTTSLPRAVSAADDEALLPLDSQAALELAAAALYAEGLLAAFLCSQTVIMLTVERPSITDALAAGCAVARALGAGEGPALVKAVPAGRRAAA
jgi:hypothetical protein